MRVTIPHDQSHFQASGASALCVQAVRRDTADLDLGNEPLRRLDISRICFCLASNVLTVEDGCLNGYVLCQYACFIRIKFGVYCQQDKDFLSLLLFCTHTP